MVLDQGTRFEIAPAVLTLTHVNMIDINSIEKQYNIRPKKAFGSDSYLRVN